MTEVHIVVLAAGQGTRMKSRMPKVLHRVAGKSMIEHVLGTAATIRPATTAVVIGHSAEAVRARFAGNSDIRFALQEPQLGTAHALKQVEPLLRRELAALSETGGVEQEV